MSITTLARTALALVATTPAAGRRPDGADGAVTHVENAFELTVHAPFARVVPLFGAWEERAWAGDDWTPEFLYPQPARDEQGEVFTLKHDLGEATWVNTILDLRSGRFQYVYVLPRVVATVIDIQATPAGAAETRVAVTYRRTALDPRHNAHVAALGQHDRTSGPEWQAQLDAAVAAPRP